MVSEANALPTEPQPKPFALVKLSIFTRQVLKNSHEVRVVATVVDKSFSNGFKKVLNNLTRLLRLPGVGWEQCDQI